jgi:hypothetical protein
MHSLNGLVWNLDIRSPPSFLRPQPAYLHPAKVPEDVHTLKCIQLKHKILPVYHFW